MKTWWVFAWCDYYPGGGLEDLQSRWATREEAVAAAKELNTMESDDYCRKYDQIRVINIMELIQND